MAVLSATVVTARSGISGENIAAGLAGLGVKTDVVLGNPPLTEYIVNNRLFQALYGQGVTV